MATTLTTRSLQAELDALAYSGRRVRRVLAPSSVWCVRDRVDMEARTARQLRLPPGATLDVVPIANEMLNSSLSLADCAAYYIWQRAAAN